MSAPNAPSVLWLNPLGLADDVELHGIGDLAMYLGGSEDSWTGDFLRLVAKSDPSHRARLTLAFPNYVQAFTVWHSTSPPTVGNLTAALVYLGSDS